MPDPCPTFVLLILLAILLIVISCKISEWAEDEKLRREAAARQAKEREDAADARKRAESARARQAEMDRAEQESRERAEAETRRAIEQSMALSATINGSVDPTQDFAAVDDLLRGIVLTRYVRGKHLLVKYVASPVGRVALEWAVTDTRWKCPCVILYHLAGLREERVLLMRDVGPNNRWGDHVGRGASRRFVLELLSDADRVVDKVEFLVTVPTAREWNDTVEPTVEPTAPPTPEPEPEDPTTAFEREITASLVQATVVRKIRDEHYGAIEQSDVLDELQKEDAKADIDSAIAKVRDKYES